MTKREKRLEKIRRNPKAVSKDELDQVLNDYGFVRREGKGSHTVYQHPDQETPIVVLWWPRMANMSQPIS
jgi:predicted RNA binding protein YcfA (HicA-like mRNA interferase family)